MNDKIAKRQIEERENINNDSLFNDTLIDPAVIADYSKIMPATPEKLLALTEEQLQH